MCETQLEVVAIVIAILALFDMLELTIKFETLCKLRKFSLAHAGLLFYNWWCNCSHLALIPLYLQYRNHLRVLQAVLLS